MLVRIRWFLAGFLAAFGGLGYLVAQVRKAREKLTPANLATMGKKQASSWLDTVADRLAPGDADRRGP